MISLHNLVSSSLIAESKKIDHSVLVSKLVFVLFIFFLRAAGVKTAALFMFLLNRKWIFSIMFMTPLRILYHSITTLPLL